MLNDVRPRANQVSRVRGKIKRYTQKLSRTVFRTQVFE